MKPRLACAATAAAALLSVAGCGSETQPTAADPTPAPVSPASTSTPEQTPTWPATGCDERSSVSIDYGRMPQGYRTPDEAVANSAAAGLPDGDLVTAPAAVDAPPVVWVVDRATDEIRAEISLSRGADGWFVDGFTTCA